MKVLSVKVSNEVYDRFRHLSEQRGISVSFLLRSVLDEYLAQTKKDGIRNGIQPSCKDLNEIYEHVDSLIESKNNLGDA